MNDMMNRNPQHVQVTKLGVTQQLPQQQQPQVAPSDNVKKFQYVPVTEETDSSSSEKSSLYGDEYTDDDDLETDTDTDTDTATQDDDATELTEDVEQAPYIGGSRNDSISDTGSVSTVSTTEILSRDPLFLVLSEFLMDDESGNNIVHVGNSIVGILSKINSKLGRIADVLEKKHKKRDDKI
jgi:hypothetical protein